METASLNLPAVLTDLRAGAALLLPEALLTAGLVLILLVEISRRAALLRALPAITGLTLAAAALALWRQPDAAPFLQRMLLTDAPARTGGLLTLLGVGLSLLVERFSLLVTPASNSEQPATSNQQQATKNQKPKTKNQKLLLALALGGVLLARSTHGIVLVLAVELLSLPSYALVFSRRDDPRAAEAALKYVLLGAVATGALLYGLSLLYGLGGSLHFADAALWQNLRLAPLPALVLAWTLVLAGLLFKLGAAPLHFWVPDAYDGAPVSVALLLSTAPKAATVVAIWRLAEGARLHLITPQAEALGLLLTGAALASLLIGTLGALGQQNVRRLLGYSSVAQAGFVLLAIRASGATGPGPVLLYAALLVLANGAVFSAVAWFEQLISKRALAPVLPPTVAAYAGLGRRFPLPAVAITLGLVGLTGLPPTLGFTAKLLAFTGLYQADTAVAGRVLLGAGVLVTAVSLFYYLRLPYWLFLRTPVPAESDAQPSPTVSGPLPLLAALLALLLLLAFGQVDTLLTGLLR